MLISREEKSALFQRQRELDKRLDETLGLVRDHMTVCKVENKARREADDAAVRARISLRKELRGYLVAIIVALLGMAVAMRGNLL